MDVSEAPLMPAAVILPVFALLTLILDVPSLVWHVRNRNLAASSMVFWVILANVMNFVNALIWPRDNIAEWWPGFVLCDIEVKLMVAGFVGVVGSLLCVMRNLAKVLDTENAVLSPGKEEKRKQLTIDALLCIGAPIYTMAVHYVVQPNRYYLIAIQGCTTSFDDSWPKMVLILIWPPILCFISVYYSCE